MDPSIRIPAHQLGLIAKESPLAGHSLDEMERAELKVVDRERTVRTPVKKKENPFSIGEGWRSGQEAHVFAQNTTRHVELHEKSRTSLDRLFQGDVDHRLQA